MPKFALFFAALVFVGSIPQVAEASGRARSTVQAPATGHAGAANSFGAQTRPRALPAVQAARDYKAPSSGCATPGNCWPYHKPKN